jgi:putative transposase
MPRIARIVGIGLPHHITQRGNYRQNIFKDDADRKIYLSLMKEMSDRYKLSILAYCLMSNHVHFIVVPEKKDSMGNVFKYVNTKYATYFNNSNGNSGHLFQARFFSSVMDDYHTKVCARYIERNPIRAGVVQNVLDWQWSSAGIHCGVENKDELNVNNLYKYFCCSKEEWKVFISEKDKEEDAKIIKQNALRGRPLGDKFFIKMLESRLGITLQFGSRGRPKKEKKE